MELRHLRYFVMAAEEKNISRAAARLNISQPAVSRQIRDLETELGVPLFDRESNGLKLNEATITAVDTVTGPYDVIVQMEAEDLDRLGTAITEGLQRIEGVQRTTTCLAVRLG